MEYNSNSWTGLQQEPTLYPNPLSLTDPNFPHQSMSRNPNPSFFSRSLVYAYGQINGATSYEESTSVYYQDPNLAQNLGTIHPYKLSEVAAMSLNGPRKAAQRKSKTQLIQCGDCKLEFNSETVLTEHRLGKKHKRKLESSLKGCSSVSYCAPTSVPPVASEGQKAFKLFIGPQEKPIEDLETKRRKVLEQGAATYEVRICQACNVVCNSESVFQTHLTGRKHMANMKRDEKPVDTFNVPQGVATDEVRICQACNVVCNSEVVFQIHLTGKKHMANMKKDEKPVDIFNVPQGAARDEVHICQACNVVCNSEAVFQIHLTGKKHMSNMKKDEKPVATFNVPQENPAVSVNLGKNVQVKENLATKAQKVLPGVATDEVRMCIVCNAVCNSETVYADHLTGRKHIANMKKYASGSVVAPAN